MCEKESEFALFYMLSSETSGKKIVFERVKPMPLFGFLRTSDLADVERTVRRGDAALRSDIADLQANQHCTQLLNGVHVCSVPRPGATVTDLQATLGSLVQTPGETCMRVDDTFGQYMDRKGFGIDRYAGTWKFPEHYVCVEQEKTQQYLDAFMNEGGQEKLFQRIQGVPVQDLLRDGLTAYSQSRNKDAMRLRSDIAANAASIASNTTSISDNAASIASNTTSISDNAASIASNATSIASNTTSIASHDTAVADLQANQHCTQLLNGVHMCSVPRPGATVVDPVDATLSTLFQTPGETCVRVDEFGDFMNTRFGAFGIRRRDVIGTMKIPDHYVCVEQDKAQQYLDGLVRKEVQDRGFNMTKGVTLQDVFQGTADQKIAQNVRPACPKILHPPLQCRFGRETVPVHERTPCGRTDRCVERKP
jgi:hypothetical protein